MEDVGSPGVDEGREFGRKMSRYLWGEDKEENGKRIFREDNENVKRWAGERGREVLVMGLRRAGDRCVSSLGRAFLKERTFRGRMVGLRIKMNMGRELRDTEFKK
jgi:hypothetical protein